MGVFICVEYVGGDVVGHKSVHERRHERGRKSEGLVYQEERTMYEETGFEIYIRHEYPLTSRKESERGRQLVHGLVFFLHVPP